MPRAEAGSTKAVANQMKAKGLQRLRWYCQACERQMRDENGFKCHVASEAHTRKMLSIGEDPRKAINEYSSQFKHDFVQLLRTGHGEKQINANRFYQEYIGNKQHVHLNSTKWNSLTEFCKYLGREGICRVDIDDENEERGGATALMISWIDNSPENLRRQDALKRKERQDRGDEHREQMLIEQQIRKARAQRKGAEREEADILEEDDEPEASEALRNVDREKIKLNFGALKADKALTPENVKPPTPPLTDKSVSPEKDDVTHEEKAEKEAVAEQDPPAPAKVSIKPMTFGTSKPKNVFTAAGKKNAFGSIKKAAPLQQQKPMSEAERIMKEEIERKRQREQHGGNAFKKQRVN